MAVPQGSAEVVRLLLGACTDKARASMADHATPQSGVAALHKAAFLGHDETVRHLLKAGAKAEITDAEGVTPLLLACRNGHASVVRALLKASSSAVGQGNNQGATPLHFAAKLGSAECCKMLLDSNATVNARAANDEFFERVRHHASLSVAGLLHLTHLVLQFRNLITQSGC
jgi:ankyrin repeat protein